MKFWTFLKKDDPQTLYISEITNYKGRAQINVRKIQFHKTFGQATWQTIPNTVEICAAAPSSYLSITVG